jgi:hypothetical protein
MIGNRQSKPYHTPRSACPCRLCAAPREDGCDPAGDPATNAPYFVFRLSVPIRLTHTEAQIASLLYRRAQVSQEALLAATHDPRKGDDERTIDIVKVHISAIRRKLSPIGIKIETIRPGFYRFDTPAKARLRDLFMGLV